MLSSLMLTYTMVAAPAAQTTGWREQVKGKWSAEAKFATPRTNTEVGRFAKADFLAAEKKIYQAFVTNTKADFKIYKEDFGLAAWSYEAGSEVVRDSGGVVSIKVGCYSYMGGAHGIGVTRTYNYALVGGKPKRLTLWDVVQKSGRQDMRLILLGHALANPNTDWIQDGIYNDFTEDQFNRFWIAYNGLVFEFNPYELGSYAAGPFTFPVAFEEMRGVLRPNNPLRDLIR